jgi:GMP synthase (glutamine-hydrolysing)
VLTAEVELLREAVDRGLPVLGVCLGGQLLASALGGSVQKARRRAVTWRELAVADPDDALFGAHASVPAVHWNEDIFTLPPGAVEVLRAPEPDGVEGFRFGDCAWGIQFHPEVDAAVLDDWYLRYADWLDQAGVAEPDARALDARSLDRQIEFAADLFGAFAAQVASLTKLPSVRSRR